MQIEQNQLLEVNHIVSFRGKVKAEELNTIGKELESMVAKAGAGKTGSVITATYSMEGEVMDIELLQPVDRKVQDTCNELNQYMMDNQLMPITAGYNVTRNVDPINIENTEIDVYVGINPNIV